MRCALTLFAEAIGILEAPHFTRAIERPAARGPGAASAEIEHLWRAMLEADTSPLAARLLRAGGHLFQRQRAIPLSPAASASLLAIAAAPWRSIEPAIFGTLLARALDPAERHALGAHYTPPAYVERLVRWTVEEPLRADLDEARRQARRLAAAGEPQRAKATAIAFLRRLCSTRVLDPACGTGNFLYLALDCLMRLEREARDLLGELGAAVEGRGLAVTPAQLYGVEIERRAKDIAELVLLLGYARRERDLYGAALDERPEARPHLELRDAVLCEARGAPLVPDWPEADFIVGNPPFVGSARMRAALGDAYVEALRRAHRDVPDGSDLVMYWWDRAAKLARSGQVRRFGLITTNSITQPLNRRIVEAHLRSGELAIVFAVPDHPWIDERAGAAVRIAMTVAERATPGATGTLARVVREPARDALGGDGDIELACERGSIHADLTIGGAALGAVRLRSNEGLASPGVKLHGAGFIVTEAEALALGRGRDAELFRRIRPYRNGRDLAQSPRGVYVIDLDGLSIDEVRARFPAVHARLLERVKPLRDQNGEAYRRDNWWLFGRRNTDLRAALRGLRRYIATAETSKHRFFTFLDAEILPDNMLVSIGLDDAFHLGVLSSRAHVAWALAMGGRMGLGNDPRYTKTRCFDPFPFPVCGEVDKSRIRELGETLDAQRKRWIEAHPALTMTGLYNALAARRAGRALAGREASVVHEGVVLALSELHEALDAAVLAAYGFALDIVDGELLRALAALNAERAAEERWGLVRSLRALVNPVS
jgi:SAM-dependent methyltransferase